jgi:small multidrug resistance pump
MYPWMWLIIAILFEVTGTMSLKISDGLTKVVPSCLTVISYVASFYILALALKSMDVGLAYAIWAGVGTGIIAFLGVVYFGEPISPIKVISLILIVAGVIGLNLAGGSH